MKNIYLICPVRNGTPEGVAEYVAECEKNGDKVHFPPRDVDQSDDGIGLEICLHHREAMEKADEVHIWWDPTSKGSHFDLGMAFALRVPMKKVYPIERTPTKSYSNVILELTK